MAGRNYIPSSALNLRESHLSRATHPALIDDPRLPHPHAAASSRTHHPALIEERIALQHREIQSLLLDNQRLAAIHVALKQELAAAQQELRHLSSAAGNVKAERDAQVRGVYDRSLKMEAELRLVDGLGAELAQVRGDVQKLSSDRKELTAKLQKIDGNVGKSRSESKPFPQIKAEIEAMHQENQRGRAAVEYEKKVHASNIEQSQAMEKTMISMAHEIEKLQAELANAEKRARAAAAAAAAAPQGFGHPEMGYGGNAYSDPYAMHQVQGGVDGGLQYGPGAVPHDPYDMQRTHLHR